MTERLAAGILLIVLGFLLSLHLVYDKRKTLGWNLLEALQASIPLLTYLAVVLVVIFSATIVVLGPFWTN